MSTVLDLFKLNGRTALCAYHRPTDLWQLQLLVEEIAPRYCFFLRPHIEEGWDLVLYAVPKHRLL